MRHRGHAAGGLLDVLLFSLALTAGQACGSSPPTVLPARTSPAPTPHTLPEPLDVYRRLGFITGGPDFPAVGRFAFLPGPGDTVYSIVGLSLPNTALRFRRDPPGFLARYRVRVEIGDSAAAVAVLDEVQDVRIHTFRETARTEESVVYQGLLPVRAGDYRARVQVQDLGSGRALRWESEIRVPEYGPGTTTPPLTVYRVEPRRDRTTPPSLILRPRATIDLASRSPIVYIEAIPDTARTVRLTVGEDSLVLDDTLAATAVPDGLLGIAATLDAERLPPGALELRSELPGGAPARVSPLLVALTPEWIAEDYASAVSYLRYAGTPAEIDTLRLAPPGERARTLRTFWERKDPVPATPENEFFELYFRRLLDANGRFAEVGRAGWLTDRGSVYITLGPPDEVLRHLDSTRGQGGSQVWRYNRSLGFDLELVFVDGTGSGSYELTPDSRRAFSEAVLLLHS